MIPVAVVAAPVDSSLHAATGAPMTFRIPLHRGMSGSDVLALQRRLNWAGLRVDRTGYFNRATERQVRHLQEKFLYNQTGILGERLWHLLVSITWRKGELPWPCTGRSICISKAQRNLRFLINGRVEKTVDVRFGPEGVPAYETAEGLFSVEWKDIDHVSSAYGSPMPFSMFFYDGQAIHYSSNFAQTGYWGNSHGCVNVRNWNALQWIYIRTPVGTPVYVYW